MQDLFNNYLSYFYNFTIGTLNDESYYCKRKHSIPKKMFFTENSFKSQLLKLYFELRNY